jgi:hypothetical protein
MKTNTPNLVIPSESNSVNKTKLSKAHMTIILHEMCHADYLPEVSILQAHEIIGNNPQLEGAIDFGRFLCDFINFHDNK